MLSDRAQMSTRRVLKPRCVLQLHMLVKLVFTRDNEGEEKDGTAASLHVLEYGQGRPPLPHEMGALGFIF